MNKEIKHSLDSFLRPKKWSDYIGQETLKDNIQILIKAAKERGQAPEHILFYGSAGLGKTTLANLIGLELGIPVKTISGAVVEKVGNIISVLSSFEKNGVLFIDEIHRLNKNIEEALYPVMESGGIDLIVGKGPSSRTVRINLPPITIIAATTQIGKISAPLRTRFTGGVMKLDEYCDDDICKIVGTSAKNLDIRIDQKSREEISKRSRGIPRTANYLLKRVRDYAQIKNKGIDPKIVDEALSARKIDSYGLTEEDRKLLKTIYEKFNGGPVGISALANTLSEDPTTIESVYEPFLLQIGFLERGPRGRNLTERGVEYLKSERII